ncbi:MAG: hypothetical protein Q9201_006802 [Fulgogasparrea decipioides]
MDLNVPAPQDRTQDESVRETVTVPSTWLDPQVVNDLVDSLIKERAQCLETIDNFLVMLAGIGANPPDIPSRKSLGKRIATATNFSHSKRGEALNIANLRKGLIYIDGDILSSDDDTVESLVSHDLTLLSEHFTTSDLQEHLRRYPWNEAARKILGHFIDNGPMVPQDCLWEILNLPRMEHEVRQPSIDMTDFTIFDVGTNGKPLHRKPRAESTQESRSKQIWDLLVGTESSGLSRAVGKVIVLREPLPCVFAAVHLTMRSHFDMDDLFRKVSDDSPTHAYMNGSLSSEPIRQRTFVFVAKYTTIVGDGRQPMNWQRTDTSDIDEAEDLRLSRDLRLSKCASVVALSLSGYPTATLIDKSRRSGNLRGATFDPMAPWRVLSLQCFPDWKISTDTFEKKKRYVNGPEAFLVAVIGEYQDAAKRFQELNGRISIFVRPPFHTVDICREQSKSIFYSGYEFRDRLLFEDEDFGQIRRYFWTSQILDVLSTEIKEFLTSYEKTFTDDVWTGNDPLIWPGPADCSPRHFKFRKRMAVLRKNFEVAIKDLEHVLELNNELAKLIKSLRDDLYCGTSILSSRRELDQAIIRIQQGYNIKLLTLATIIYLPLVFVAGVFGMTNMPTGVSFRPFAVVLVCLESIGCLVEFQDAPPAL